MNTHAAQHSYTVSGCSAHLEPEVPSQRRVQWAPARIETAASHAARECAASHAAQECAASHAARECAALSAATSGSFGQRFDGDRRELRHIEAVARCVHVWAAGCAIGSVGSPFSRKLQATVRGADADPLQCVAKAEAGAFTVADGGRHEPAASDSLASSTKLSAVTFVPTTESRRRP
jgi:hypothetical protein